MFQLSRWGAHLEYDRDCSNVEVTLRISTVDEDRHVNPSQVARKTISMERATFRIGTKENKLLATIGG